MLKIQFTMLLFFLIIDLHFLILAVIAQILNHMAELGIPLGIPSNEAKEEKNLQKLKQENVQYNLESYKPFYTYYSSIHFCLFL